MPQPLYDRIGGDAAVTATVIKMYDKILGDDLLAPFFEHTDVHTLRHSQISFVTHAFGGPQHYTGKSLRAAHTASVTRGLTDVHFDRVANHLKSSMSELGFPPDLINEAMTIVESTRADVLNRPDA